jgi:hypothetical protein
MQLIRCCIDYVQRRLIGPHVGHSRHPPGHLARTREQVRNTGGGGGGGGGPRIIHVEVIILYTTSSCHRFCDLQKEKCERASCLVFKNRVALNKHCTTVLYNAQYSAHIRRTVNLVPAQSHI